MPCHPRLLIGHRRLRALTALVVSSSLSASLFLGGCGGEPAQIASDPSPEFSSHIEGVGTLSLRSPAHLDKDGTSGLLRVDVNGRSREIRVEFAQPVFALTSTDPESGETLWKQSYRTIDGSRHYEVSEESGGFGLRWVRETIREGVWAETFVALGVETTPLECTVDESRPETVHEARTQFQTWLPAEVRDAVYDNPEGQIVNSVPRLLEENVSLLPDYAATTEARRVPEEVWFEAVCTVALGCSLIKCNFGGALNPVCSICFGVVVTCAFCALLNVFGITCT